jgi:hypothetical protein
MMSRMMHRIPRLVESLGSEILGRVFNAAATALSAAAGVLAVSSLAAGDFGQGILLAGVAVFSAWMATAIHQFQARLAAIDEVVRQSKKRIEQSDRIAEEMRRLAKRMTGGPEAEEKEQGRTLH